MVTLQHRFKKLFYSYSNDFQLIKSLWQEIESHYTEPHRAYHNLTHLEELFEYYKIYRKELKKPDLVAFAIFYHDIIYGIWNKKNEEQSAEKALKVLQKLSLSHENLKEIESHILATKSHTATSNDAKWMIDFDLAILGSNPEKYQHYSQLIRREYNKVPWLLYKRGRKKMLKHFIDKPFIYSTSAFRNLYEKQAKLNLEQELKMISKD